MIILTSLSKRQQLTTSSPELLNCSSLPGSFSLSLRLQRVPLQFLGQYPKHHQQCPNRSHLKASNPTPSNHTMRSKMARRSRLSILVLLPRRHTIHHRSRMDTHNRTGLLRDLQGTSNNIVLRPNNNIRHLPSRLQSDTLVLVLYPAPVHPTQLVRRVIRVTQALSCHLRTIDFPG